MPKSNLPLQDLVIFLLNEDIAKAPKALSKSGLRPTPVRSGDQSIGTLYVQPTHSSVPKWARFFEGTVEPRVFGRVASSSALFFVEAADRLFALSFGHGRHLLRPGCWEERFGLRVALNCLK